MNSRPSKGAFGPTNHPKIKSRVSELCRLHHPERFEGIARAAKRARQHLGEPADTRMWVHMTVIASTMKKRPSLFTGNTLSDLNRAYFDPKTPAGSALARHRALLVRLVLKG